MKSALRLIWTLMMILLSGRAPEGAPVSIFLQGHWSGAIRVRGARQGFIPRIRLQGKQRECCGSEVTFLNTKFV
jgi:hypothetical protein